MQLNEKAIQLMRIEALLRVAWVYEVVKDNFVYVPDIDIMIKDAEDRIETAKSEEWKKHYKGKAEGLREVKALFN